MKLVTKMNNKEAKNFFLKGSSYFNLDLPQYFDFNNILKYFSKEIGKKSFKSICIKNNKGKLVNITDYDKVNFKMLNNKDGRYAWRPFEIIHPALYVCLVNEICKENNWTTIKSRFKQFSSNKNIVCCSIPIESNNKKKDKRSSILRWWSEFEQRTIDQSLNYKHMIITDISNCYPSIYTHTISWAIHGKEFAKEYKNIECIGNNIDKLIRNMSYGQTNGIPQGSVLMDFIAEIVLGYADLELSEKIGEVFKDEKIDYKILRYRDDYRIFSNNTEHLKIILKCLTEVLSELNFKLNNTKTLFTENIITDSIKKDKLYRFQNPISDNLSIQKKLFLIREIGNKFPNCGSLLVLLTNLYEKDILNLAKKPNSIEQIISIIVDIMYNNPNTYPICTTILSALLEFFKYSQKEFIIDKIINKFKDIPNIDYLEIWLQRITIAQNINKQYNSKLCKKLYLEDDDNKKYNVDKSIWNSEWLDIKFDESEIINKEKLNNISNVISKEEVENFSISYFS